MGRAYAAAMAIADAANGGQILITWPVAEALLSHMHLIQFPQLSSMGTFRLKKAVDEVELFDLQPRESLEMPMRSFPLPRNVDFLSPGTGAAVIRPPESEAVTFVVVNISGSIMQGLIGRETNKRSSAPMKAHSLVDLAMRKLSTCATQVSWALCIPSFLQRCVAECRSCVLLPLAERRLHLDVQPRVPNVCDGTPQAISCAHCETKVWQGSRPDPWFGLQAFETVQGALRFAATGLCGSSALRAFSRSLLRVSCFGVTCVVDVFLCAAVQVKLRC